MMDMRKIICKSHRRLSEPRGVSPRSKSFGARLAALLVVMLAVTMLMVPLAKAAEVAMEKPAGEDKAVATLAGEVRDMGWVAFAARSEKGDWDLFVMRPDGSALRNITNTPDANEAYPLFSPNGKRLLYRQLKRDEMIDGNNYGAQGRLMFAKSDGTDPQPFGQPGEYPWASWSPDGQRIACLDIKGISFVDLETKKVAGKQPREGFFQQMTWSPDGKTLSGVSNGFGTAWSVAAMDIASGKPRAISSQDCCTPDWFPDGRHLIFSKRPGQWTQLWMADPQGRNPRLLYAEDGRHIYGGRVSPDGKYALFTGNINEDGDPGNSGAPMALMRLTDAPLIGGDGEALRKQHPQAKAGPVLTLPIGWEPCWTASETPGGETAKDDATKHDAANDQAAKETDVP